MKYRVVYLFWCIILLGCTQKEITTSTFSEHIDYQYLLYKNSKFGKPIETYKIRYTSDGLEITGYLTKFEDFEKRPTILFLRGGNRDFGTFTSSSLKYQQYLSSQGFNVLSTQLRGNIFSEGEDQFGGKDLNDILKLIDINNSLKFATKKIGVYGISRGGLNAYQISRLTDEIEAIAVVGAPTNLMLDLDTRPEMYENVYEEIIGDSLKNKSEYDYRTPLLWVDEINEPVLILHGRDDWRVKPINAELMIKEMKKLNKDFDFQIIDNGDHGLNTHKELRNKKIIDWFNKYLN